jgi:class 3 adenylate cyclase
MTLAYGDGRTPRRDGQSIPFRLAIITMVVGLLVVTCGFLLAFGIYTGRKSIEALKSEYLEQVANTTAREVSRLPDTAERILQVQRYRLETGLYVTTDPIAMARALAAALQTDADVQWVSYSEDATGRFIGARRLQGSDFILNLSDPRQNGGVPRELRADTLAPFVTPSSQTRPYDPRPLAWYRRAMAQPGAVIWMPPYVFTEGVKGVTVASTAADPSGRVLGVLTVDFALTGVANFLRGVKIGDNGVVVLFDENGAALAGASGPGLEAATRAVKDGARGLGRNALRHVEVESGGQRWDVVTRSLSRGPGFQWTAAVAVPEEDFMGAVNANRRTAIAIALAGVLLAILVGAGLSTRMARSLGIASAALDRVARFDLAEAPTRRSRVKEIARLQDAVGRVLASLRSFTRYAPEEIVREVAVSGREAMLSGDKRDVSVLFSDLRGFTAFAEHMSAEEVVAILNDHFELLVGIITRHRGFVVDFLGDAVFVVFGAPEASPTHARQAVACAIEMQQARTARNRENRSRGWPPLEMGIGIGTGPVVVGNMGALRRIKYGVVGSIVNTAARIETFTVGGQALMSDVTRQALGDQAVVNGPMEAEGKGVDAAIRIWEILALRGEPMLTLPSPVRDLAELPAPLDARVRVFLGKQLDRQSHPARLLRLGAGGAQLETGAPLSVFGALQLLLPMRDGEQPLDGKVIATSDQDGARTFLVRFTGIGWDLQERIDAVGRERRGSPRGGGLTS